MIHLVFICRHERHHDRNLWCSGLQQCHMFAKITPTELNPSPMSHDIQKNPPHGIYIYKPKLRMFPKYKCRGGKKKRLSQRLTQELSQELWPELDMELRQKRHDVIAALGKSWVGGMFFFLVHQNWCFQAFPTDPCFSVGRSSATLLSGFWGDSCFFVGGGYYIYI